MELILRIRLEETTLSAYSELRQNSPADESTFGDDVTGDFVCFVRDAVEDALNEILDISYEEIRKDFIIERME